jgi:hypothetical protein
VDASVKWAESGRNKDMGRIIEWKKTLVLVVLLCFLFFGSTAGLTVSMSNTTGAKGSTVEVPINLEGATKVGSMDIAFEVIGDAGTTSYLTLEEVSVHNLDLAEIIPTTVNGTFFVI